MKENFDKAIEIVLRFEGGYVHNAKDPGGETKYGISKKAYPGEDIVNMTQEKAKELYRKDYWDKIDGDALGSPLDIVALDTAVLCGVGAAREMVAAAGRWEDLLFARLEYHTRKVKQNPNLATFLRGWVNRVIQLYGFVKGDRI